MRCAKPVEMEEWREEERWEEEDSDVRFFFFFFFFKYIFIYFVFFFERGGLFLVFRSFVWLIFSFCFVWCFRVGVFWMFFLIWCC